MVSLLFVAKHVSILWLPELYYKRRDPLCFFCLLSDYIKLNISFFFFFHFLAGDVEVEVEFGVGVVATRSLI